jgi:hypothetical protein
MQKSRSGLLLFLGAIVPCLILFLLAPFGWTADRYAFITLSSWIILSAVAVKELFYQAKGQQKILVLGVILLFVVGPIFENATYFRGQQGRRPDWDSVYTFIEQEKLEGDVVIATKYKLAHYYLDQDVLSINDTDPNVVINNGQRTWFVVDAMASWVRPTTVNWIRKNGQLVRVFHVYIDDWPTNVLIYLYDPTKD